MVFSHSLNAAINALSARQRIAIVGGGAGVLDMNRIKLLFVRLDILIKAGDMIAFQSLIFCAIMVITVARGGNLHSIKMKDWDYSAGDGCAKYILLPNNGKVANGRCGGRLTVFVGEDAVFEDRPYWIFGGLNIFNYLDKYNTARTDAQLAADCLWALALRENVTMVCYFCVFVVVLVDFVCCFLLLHRMIQFYLEIVVFVENIIEMHLILH